MHIDFALILVILTVLSGGIALVDKLFFAAKRKRHGQKAKEPKLVEYSRSFFPVFLIVLLIRSFLLEPFRIPSGSLEPTLLTGDFVLVNKYQYGLRVPVVNHRFLEFRDPQKGEIVVFRWPQDPRIDYIKRIIGVPGDQISYKNKRLTVNGQPVPQQFVNYATYRNATGEAVQVAVYEETLDNKTYQVYQRTDIPARDFSIVVPEGHYFALGDNRDDSSDSRHWGVVDEELLVGKAFAVWMSWDKHDKGVRWGRIGKTIE